MRRRMVSFCNAAPCCFIGTRFVKACMSLPLKHKLTLSWNQIPVTWPAESHRCHQPVWFSLNRKVRRQGFFCSNLPLTRAIVRFTTSTCCSVSERLRSLCYSASEMEVNWQAVSHPGWIYTRRAGRRLLAYSSQLTKETEVTCIA